VASRRVPLARALARRGRWRPPSSIPTGASTWSGRCSCSGPAPASASSPGCSATEPPLLLLAHTDVVGAAGQQWTSPPHQVTERDGYLVGRGVDDDLGMAAVALEVLLAVKQSTLMLRRDVILAWTGDEESGGGGIRWLLEHARPSITAAVALNEGGGPRLDDQGRVVRVALQTAEKTYQDFNDRRPRTDGPLVGAGGR
jgi:acetylornithine deacetylase/succinyl-diaminopimelate desuccinylase-like protein